MIMTGKSFGSDLFRLNPLSSGGFFLRVSWTKAPLPPSWLTLSGGLPLVVPLPSTVTEGMDPKFVEPSSGTFVLTMFAVIVLHHITYIVIAVFFVTNRDLSTMFNKDFYQKQKFNFPIYSHDAKNENISLLIRFLMLMLKF